MRRRSRRRRRSAREQRWTVGSGCTETSMENRQKANICNQRHVAALLVPRVSRRTVSVWKIGLINGWHPAGPRGAKQKARLVTVGSWKNTPLARSRWPLNALRNWATNSEYFAACKMRFAACKINLLARGPMHCQGCGMNCQPHCLPHGPECVSGALNRPQTTMCWSPSGDESVCQSHSRAEPLQRHS